MAGGFFGGDYLLVFAVADPERRAALTALCEATWGGEKVAGDMWEISNDLNPHEMEAALLPFVQEGDRAVYYYLSDSKRLFRVIVAA